VVSEWLKAAHCHSRFSFNTEKTHPTSCLGLRHDVGYVGAHRSAGVADARRAYPSVVMALLAAASLLVILPSPGTASLPSTVSAFPHPAHFVVSYHEQGLPRGTHWSVSIQGPEHRRHGTYLSRGVSVKLSLQNGTYNFSISAMGFTATPPNGSFTVNGTDLTENVTFGPPSYAATFTEQGLPSGTSWSVVLNGTATISKENSLSFAVPNGTYAFTSSAAGYSAEPPNGSLVIDGANATVSLSFVPFTYGASFVEQGLPANSSWSVTVGTNLTSSNDSTISLELPNGTYDFAVGPRSGWIASPENGSFTVDGASTSTSILWTGPQPTKYPVDFMESGLPAGASWSVTLSGATNSSSDGSIYFWEANGTYPYQAASVGYDPSPAVGSVDVSGAPIGIPITWTPASYAVLFTETGLPAGTNWWLVVKGVSYSSTTETITLHEPTGVYLYIIHNVPGWTTTQYTGTVAVQKGPATVSVEWTQVVYTVTVRETGLPSGDVWAATLDGVAHNGSSSVITFKLPNGTYSFSLSLPSGYEANVTTGPVIVEGAPAEVVVTVVAAEVGLDLDNHPLTSLQVAAVVVVVVIVSLTGILWLRDRKGGAPPPTT